MREWLLDHGGWIGPLLVVAVAIGPLGCVLLLRYLTVFARVRRERASQRTQITQLGEGRVVLCGTLHPSEPAWLACGDERIALAGPMRVVNGSRVRWRWNEPQPNHSVREGDDVIAVGTCERAPDDDPATTSYRTAGSRWVLRPHGEAITIFALRPVVPRRSLGIVRTLAIVATSGVLGYLAMAAYGRSVVSREASDQRYHDAHQARDAWLPASLAIAAAIPGTRQEALERVDREMSYYRRTPARREARIRVARLRGCERHVQVLTEERRYDEAVTAAGACGRPELAFRALVLDGRYDDATSVGKRLIDEYERRALVAVAIGAGRWAEAADALDGLFGSQDRYVVSVRACFAAWLRARGGDKRANEALAQQHPAPCGGLDALLGGPDDLRAHLETNRGQDDPADDVLWTMTPGRTGDARRRIEQSPLDVWLNQGASSSGRGSRMWLVPFARDDAEHRHYWAAQLALRLDDPARARAELAAELASVSEESASDVADVARMIWLRTGPAKVPDEIATPREDTDDRFVALRNGTMPQERMSHLQVINASNSRELHVALAAAIAGDGDPLAALLADEDFLQSDTLKVLIAVLPHVQRERREQLASVTELAGGLASTFGLKSLPFWWVDTAALHRDATRLAGNNRDAERWQQLIDRHAKVLADRERLIALLWWTDLWWTGLSPL